MTLERYQRKRDFKVTPEPAGKVGKARSSDLSFVVQKHAASHLHYDFRLELDGVLLSWAVPKGPSLDPNDKRLAMQTEDHPLEYGDFEGVIPAKQYGGGTVMVWDRGTWTPKADPREGYAKGRLKFDVDGQKLKGGFNLVRSRSGKYGGENSWLLIKEADDHARLGSQAKITDDRPDSAVSGRSIEEIAADGDRVWHSNRSAAENKGAAKARKSRKKSTFDPSKVEGTRKSALPDFIAPQLATLTRSPPTGSGWVHEIKYDGYRMLARIADGRAQMVSRTAKNWTGEFPSLSRPLGRLPVSSAWLDGEVVVIDDKGRTSFQRLQNALSEGAGATLTYIAFDLLYLDGYDLRTLALVERKRMLQQLLSTAPPTLKYSEHFAASGTAFLQNVTSLGLEGMISKQSDAPYRSGRGTTWLKLKCAQRQEMVIGGYTDPEGTREAFGALLLGVYEPDGTLSYSGKVGTGFNAATLSSLHRSLKSIERSDPPFHNPPRGAEARRAHWVKPELVAEVSFTEWTNDGTLRHPSFQGLRSDKPAKEVVREQAGHETADAIAPSTVQTKKANSKSTGAPAAKVDKNTIAGITLSNPDKLLYPEAKLSKRDLANYYTAVAEWMLPHVRARPLSLVRCPNGWDKTCFYQKHVDAGVHASISRVAIPESDGGESDYMMAESVSALVAMVQMGVLEVHPWGSRAQHLGLADRLVFDLDPEESLPWEKIKEAVGVVKALMENLGLVPFLKSTGGKGLHVVVPIEPTQPWEHVKGFTKAVAELLERTFPDRFTSKLLKVSRRGRIFIDYLRNAEGATAVAAYSLRAKAEAPVSTPLAWNELGKDIRFAHFTALSVPKRLAKLEVDPWKEISTQAAPLTTALMAKVGYKPR